MADWWPTVQDHPDTTPHALILGPSGKGKSVLIEALTRTRSGQVLVIQPNKKEHEWQGVSLVQCADDGSYLPIALRSKPSGQISRHGGAMRGRRTHHAHVRSSKNLPGNPRLQAGDEWESGASPFGRCHIPSRAA
jgi:hypothetical protein